MNDWPTIARNGTDCWHYQSPRWLIHRALCAFDTEAAIEFLYDEGPARIAIICHGR
jgi:hypothetical protein